jgi:(1->4)-alpha-D-glucan 1-alpha-D-glucosylmutase
LQSLYRQHKSAEENGASAIYVVAEKILSGDEPLPGDWAVSGTTGYDLMNVLSRIQIHADGLAKLRSFYDQVTGSSAKPADVVYESKRTVLFSSMSSELQMLAAALYRIAQSHRASRDYTRPALQRGLREVIACMTVYRTYVRGDSWDISDADYRTVTTAVRMAKRRNRTLPVAVFDYIASVLLLEHPPTVTDEQAIERRTFALKFQQVSGPVAAKGVEDTAFYRYYPLASLNEVGGELLAKPLSVDEFHRLMRHRLESWPHSLSATSTHDSKRGEDLRARLHVLSEAPQEWTEAFSRWQKLTQPFVREMDGDAVPDLNEQYLLFQTLVGTWPADEMGDSQRDNYAVRIIKYAEKSLREAKIHTSWMNPSESYETAVYDFIHDLLGAGCQAFRTELAEFVRRISDAGFVNSLAQLVLKMTVPGVPDFYRGTELWDFNLVDPDNRRPVDYDLRRERLDSLWKDANRDVQNFAQRLVQRWPDPDIKLWIMSRCLNLRRERAELFSFGDYIPLAADGSAAEHVIAFARRNQQDCIVVVPRHYYQLQSDDAKGSGRGVPGAEWKGTLLQLPDDFAGQWRCELSGRVISARQTDSRLSLDLADLFDVWPVAVLTEYSK